MPQPSPSLRHAWPLALALLAACGDEAPVTPDASATPREVITGTRELLVGDIVEGILDGGAGDQAVIRVTAPVAALDWNIHGHASGGTQTVAEELGVMTVDYAFTPAEQADWYLLLRNRHTAPMTVQLEIALYGAMQWSGWQ